MLISSAAAHGASDSGSSGGGNALLIILGVFILLGLLYLGWNKLRRRLAKRDGNGPSREGQPPAAPK